MVMSNPSIRVSQFILAAYLTAAPVRTRTILAVARGRNPQYYDQLLPFLVHIDSSMKIKTSIAPAESTTVHALLIDSILGAAYGTHVRRSGKERSYGWTKAPSVKQKNREKIDNAHME